MWEPKITIPCSSTAEICSSPHKMYITRKTEIKKNNILECLHDFKITLFYLELLSCPSNHREKKSNKKSDFKMTAPP